MTDSQSSNEQKEECGSVAHTAAFDAPHVSPGFDRLACVLSSEMGDLSTWKVKSLTGGGVSKHTYKMWSEGTIFFVKEIEDNERYTLQLLHQLGLHIAPQIVFAELLDHHVLVTTYIEGEMIREKRLDAQLIRDFAHMQNALNEPAHFRSHKTPSGCTYTDHDDGFFRSGMLTNFEVGYGNLLLLRAYELPIVDRYLALADRIHPHVDRLAGRFARDAICLATS